MTFDLMTFLQPLVAVLLAAASAAVTTVVPVVIKWLLQKVKLDGLLSDDVVRGYLNDVMDKAINLAKAKVAEQKLTINVDNAVAAFALDYLQQHVPDALAHFGLTEAKVQEMVKARLVNFTV